MNTFYFSSALVQSALMTAMFLSLLLSLFLMFYNYDRKRKRAVRYLNIAIFLLLFVILAMLADTSMRIDENLPIRILLPIPVWVFWVITCACDIYLICEIIRQYRQKDKILHAIPLSRPWIHCRVQYAIFHPRVRSNFVICKCTACFAV